MKIGNRLKYHLEKSGLSANKLAKAVDLTPSQISKIINEESKPSFDALERICETFGITMGKFFSEPNDVFYVVRKNSPEYQLLCDEIKKEGLPPDETLEVNPSNIEKFCLMNKVSIKTLKKLIELADQIKHENAAD